MVLKIYKSAAIDDPIIVARGMVFVGFFTLSDGIVADSNPRNAQSVNAAVAVIALKLDLSLRFKGVK